MLSVTAMKNLYGSLTQNTSTENLALGLQIMNLEQRYLLQKYFSNEGSFSTTTVGSQDLTATGSFAANATTGTLTAAWAYHTTKAQVTFSNGDVRNVSFTKNSTSISWTGGLSSTATTALDVGGCQFYPAPPNYSKMKTVTIQVGNLQWTPQEVLTRQEWDKLNVFPYYADIPNNYFIYPGGDHGVQVGIWPIPSTTGNLITYNYKYRIPDLSIEDYTTPGTVSVTSGSTAVTGSSTTFAVTTNAPLESRWIRFAPTSTASTSGDNLWYQIASVDSTTAISLYQPYQGSTVTASPASSPTYPSLSTGYTIGQMPILMEDFHDMLVYKAVVHYFTSIVDNPKKAAEFQSIYNNKLELLDQYAGQKSVDVNLARKPLSRNPNLFPQSIGI